MEPIQQIAGWEMPGWPCAQRRGVTTIRAWLMASILSLILLPLAQAAPQRFDVFDVFIGYDGLVPEGSWFPVVCEIENKGPSFNAVFELSERYEDQTRQMPIELPTGTRKRFVMPVFSANRNNRQWEARLLDDRGRHRADGLVRQVRRQYSGNLPLVGAVSRTANGRPVFPTVKDQNRREVQVEAARLLPELFPDNPIALEGLDTLYLSTAQATEDRLRVNQVNALLAWLNAGGHLIVGVEQLAQINGAPWLRQMLPVDFSQTTSLTNHSALQDWLVSNRRIDGRQYQYSQNNTSASNSRVRNNQRTTMDPFSDLPREAAFEDMPLSIATGKLFDGQVVVGTETAPLVITARRGRGQITVLTFSPELEPFLSWTNRPYFWSKLANLPLEVIPPNVMPNWYANYSIDGVFGAMIESRQVRKLPVGWLLLLLLGYLVVIGPLDRYWLKKINRQMLTWITFPGYVVFFSLLIYYIGYKLRAGESEWNELNVVDVLPQRTQAQLHGRTFASIYSPANARYPLACDLPFASLRGELLRRSQGGREATRANVRQRGNNFVAEIFVPVWTSQLYVNNWWDQASLPLNVQVHRQNNGYEVRVENRQNRPLTEARLVVAGKVFALGAVPAGQTRTIAVTQNGTALASFVRNEGNRFREAINRRQRAFGENLMQFPNPAASSMAACFISELDDRNQSYNSFMSPPGFDLSRLVERGDAVVLAWTADYAPVKPFRQFSPRRDSHNTLWRMACEVQP